MRLRRLDLLRYGHLSDVALDFPADAPLCVVAGRNEAGKSTALAAISDALFGFPERTPFGFLHEGSQLRVGFTLAARDGGETAFLRRKGRRDTLRDAEDQPVPEAVLARFLGGIGRKPFEARFGLNGARLREGAQDLLLSGGEAGESILAGMGLMHLRTALARLDEEAKSLFGDGRGRRRLSAAIDTWRTAQAAAEEASVRPRDWEQATEDHARTVARLAELRDTLRALTAEARRLERFRRVRLPLAELQAARHGLAAVADAPRLPADAEAVLRRAADERRIARLDAEREAADIARLDAARAALPQDPAVLDLQDEIDALAERRPIAGQAAQDLPGVHAGILALRAAVADAARDLGIATPPEALRDSVPPDSLRRRAHALIRQRAALAAQAGAAAEALAAARRRHEAATAELDRMPVPPSPAPLRRAIEAVRAEGPLDLDLGRAERALAGAAQATQAALAALPLWAGDAAALVACAVPLQAETEAVAARLAASAQAQAAARQSAADLATAIAQLDEEIAELARGETVATRDAVAAARALRDRSWGLIRGALDGAAAPPVAQQRADLPDGPLADVFETLRDEADRIADQRADDAQRVADYQARTARRAVLLGRRAEAEAALADAIAGMAAAEAAWQALWSPAGLEPQGPAAMVEWRRARSEVLRLLDAEHLSRQRRDELADRRERARAALMAMLPAAEPTDTVAGVLTKADTACLDAEAAVLARQRLADRVRQDGERLPELRDAADAAATKLEASGAEWRSVAAALGLDAQAGGEAVESALTAWMRIAEAAEAWRRDESRIARMEQETGRFARQTQDLLARLSEPASDAPAAFACGRLAGRLADARKARDEALALSRRIAERDAARAAATQRLLAAERVLEDLRASAGAGDDQALEAAIARARQRDALVTGIDRLETLVLEQGDGLGEEALRTEAAGIDADAVPARLAEIEAEHAALGDERDRLGTARAEAEARLARMRAGQDAAGRAQEAETALADARDAAERYGRVHLARVLLRAGIERFRAEQQGPLLRGAGEHFARLTAGRYARLGVDEDATGRTILRAVREDGLECPVESLSEGTRDQLYLALRIAAVQDHARHAEPLPFIADDLLVHFDDTRADAALTVLSDLGRATQVVLFTHHEHIVELARRQPGAAIRRLPEGFGGLVAQGAGRAAVSP
ncbi:AAA family ATPase [Roseomonas sp. CAU 1739]|uniref:AAA family ATPase n=1 Tax=Roseomonas sp. CAU 1739 TaxID=3140364 RepID=UPI00325AF5B5